jgi:hypothetical protein
MPASESAVSTNEYNPIYSKNTATQSWSYRGNSFYSRIAVVGDETQRRATDQYLADNGYTNMPFRTSTAGVLTPNQAYGPDGDPRIKRGFIWIRLHSTLSTPFTTAATLLTRRPS